MPRHFLRHDAQKALLAWLLEKGVTPA